LQIAIILVLSLSFCFRTDYIVDYYRVDCVNKTSSDCYEQLSVDYVFF